MTSGPAMTERAPGRADLHIHTPRLGRDGGVERDPGRRRSRRTSTSSRSPTTSGSTPPWPAGPSRSRRRPAASRSSSARRSRPAAATSWACSSSEPIQPWQSLRGVDRRRPRAGRPRHPGPSARARTRCAPRACVLRRLLADADPRFHPDAHRDVQPDHARPAAGTRRVVRFAAEPRPGARSASSDAHARRGDRPGSTTFPGRTADDLRAAILARDDAAGTARSTRPRGQLGTFGRQLRKYGRDAARRGRRPAPPRRHRAATTATPAAASGRRASSRPDVARHGTAAMKIGLVTPYVYPLPGGVNEHVRYLYENLRLRGHDVRIISSSHGLQRASEGDVIRLGKGFSMPTNGSVGTLTRLAALRRARSAGCSSASGSTSSTSTSRSCRSCRRSCCASRGA